MTNTPANTTMRWTMVGVFGAVILWTLKVVPDAMDIARSWLLPEQEIKFWESAERCGTVECIQVYIDKYPDGQFIAIAKKRTAVLTPSIVPITTSVAPISTTPLPVSIDNKQLLELQAKLATEQAKIAQLEQQRQQAEQTIKAAELIRQLAIIEAKKQAIADEVAALQRQAEQPVPQQLISSRYQDNGDGTVTDVTTNLMWKRCSEGQTWNGNTCNGVASLMPWDNSMPNEQQKSWPQFAGYNDWRLPNREELKSLVYCSSGDPKTWNDIINETKYYGCHGEYQQPTIDQTAFPSTPKSLYWTATPYTNACCSRFVDFMKGGTDRRHREHHLFVRCVRAGQ